MVRERRAFEGGQNSRPCRCDRQATPRFAQSGRSARDYVARRTAEGKTSREIKRCLARYVARDLYRLLESGAAAA
jgi:hypothetical protein